MPKQSKPFYRRFLPHWQPAAATVFITFRLVNSLPQHVLVDLAAERDRLFSAADKEQGPERRATDIRRAHSVAFDRWDRLLAEAKGEAKWLERADVAEVVANVFHRGERQLYDLDALCIMPNHVHAVLTPLCVEDGQCHSLGEITQSVKGSSAYEANRVLGRRGPFWQHESYDHVVRDAGELARVVRYVLLNPVKARLVDDWRDWPWSYARFEPEGL